MKRMFPRKLRFWLWAALFVGYSVAVAGVVVDAVGDNYRRLTQVARTTTAAPLEQRQLGAAQIAALYRAQSPTPFQALPPGNTFRVVWPDGSTEMVRIVSQSTPHGAVPVGGSQIEAAPVLDVAQAELQVVPVSVAPRQAAVAE
ncbi:conserved hypothetical protein [Luteimonas sp. 9C]|uniref:hypothetical protein n=1 Tax=Luteimonas sp. 9C TaxID=2653148 RepID=UPI0012F31A36|nr:hypothetical protein [Luteimonas sp. 9C]VXA92290.1 conserved hypothetical protein [Luteimonas sp. 9C]